MEEINDKNVAMVIGADVLKGFIDGSGDAHSKQVYEMINKMKSSQNEADGDRKIKLSSANPSEII